MLTSDRHKQVFGWGPPNGYVYQKAYVEFFVSEKGARVLASTIDEHFPSLAYMGLSNKGLELSNRPDQGLHISLLIRSKLTGRNRLHGRDLGRFSWTTSNPTDSGRSTLICRMEARGF